MQYGETYAWKFWESYKKLFDAISYPNLARWWEVSNADFAHKVFYSRDCYLSFEICYSEKVAYSVNVKDNCYNVINSVMVGDNSEVIANSVCIFKSSNVFYSKFIVDSSFIWFSSNLTWCHDCIACSALQNQSYCIQNTQYSKEEYLLRKETILQDKRNFDALFSQIPMTEKLLACKDTTGIYTIKSTDLEDGNFTYRINHGKNTLFVGNAEWSEYFYDVASAAYGKHYYGIVGGGQAENAYCSVEIVWGSKIFYSYFLNDCSYCLGCIGLKNKSFCILNKQYTQEERFVLANDIFAQMEKDWSLWAFFPWWMNPFYFNDTAAYLIDDSFTKDEVTKEGYLWRDEAISADIPPWADIISTDQITNYQWFDTRGKRVIDKKILKKVVKDEKWNYYKIVPMELDFLQKYGLPLPELHRLDRIKLGFKFK